MKLLFMGTPEFALFSLARILESSHLVTGVVTRPDRPQGRGLKVSPSPVKKLALEKKIPVLQPFRLPDPELTDFLKQTRPEAVVVVAYGLKIPTVLLEYPLYGCINLHASLLPKYRGAAPIQAALINGDSITGVTTIKMDEGWDTGGILLSREVTVGEWENAGSLHDRLAGEGAELLVETLTRLEKGEVAPVPQEKGPATYAPKLDEEDFVLDWSASTRDLCNRIRALDPWPGARTRMGKKTLKVWAARPARLRPDLAHVEPGTTGEFRKGEDKGLPVRTGDGVIVLTELQLSGKRRLSAIRFLAGRPVPPGTVLG